MISHQKKITFSSIFLIIPILLILSSITFGYISPKAIAQTLPANTTNDTGVANSSQINDMQGFLPYENSSYGIKIQYPYTWQLVHSGDDPITVVKFVSPQQSIVSVSIAKLTQNAMTLEEYNRSLIDDRKSRGFYLIDSAATDIAGNPAQKLVFGYGQGQDRINAMNAFMIKGSIVYQINYVANENQYAADLPEVQKMINSIRITDLDSSQGSNTNFDNMPNLVGWFIQLGVMFYLIYSYAKNRNMPGMRTYLGYKKRIKQIYKNSYQDKQEALRRLNEIRLEFTEAFVRPYDSTIIEIGDVHYYRNLIFLYILLVTVNQGFYLGFLRKMLYEGLNRMVSKYAQRISNR
jgi:hypothetical protein